MQAFNISKTQSSPPARDEQQARSPLYKIRFRNIHLLRVFIHFSRGKRSCYHCVVLSGRKVLEGGRHHSRKLTRSSMNLFTTTYC